MAATRNIHDKEAALYYVIDGGGTMISGGNFRN